MTDWTSNAKRLRLLRERDVQIDQRRRHDGQSNTAGHHATSRSINQKAAMEPMP